MQKHKYNHLSFNDLISLLNCSKIHVHEKEQGVPATSFAYHCLKRRKLAEKFIYVSFLRDFHERDKIGFNYSFLPFVRKEEKRRLMNLADKLGIRFSLKEKDVLFGLSQYGGEDINLQDVFDTLFIKNTNRTHELVKLSRLRYVENKELKDYFDLLKQLM